MKPLRFFILAALAFIAPLCAGTSAAPAQATKPVTAAHADALEVHEWMVFVLDGSTGALNPDGLVKSTLPAFVTSRRGEAPADAQATPSPVGVIRLSGSADSKVDVKLGKAGGSFMASWPKAQTRSSELLWQDLTIGGEAGKLADVPAGNWFAQLREAQGPLLISRDGGAEKFLIYDIEMPYSCPISVQSREGGFGISNIGKAPLHDLMLYRADHGHWHREVIGELPVMAAPATAPATNPAGASRSTTTAAGAYAIRLPDAQTNAATTAADAHTTRVADAQTNAATTAPMPPIVSAHQAIAAAAPPAANTASSTHPAAPASTGPGVVVAATGPATRAAANARAPQITAQLTAVAATQPSDFAAVLHAALADKLASPQDLTAIAAIVQHYVVVSHSLTAVYRLDDAEIDRLLPLEVVPQPKKITRVALVIVRNIDPMAGSEIDELITQLGDASWSKRQAAYEALKGMGAAAVPKLQAATRNKDLEIVWRAERLIVAAGQQPQQ